MRAVVLLLCGLAAALSAATATTAPADHHAAVRNAKDDPHPLDLIRCAGFTVPGDRAWTRADAIVSAAITISATPSQLVTNGDWVTVTWSGVSKPKGDDWIGVYSPSTADPKQTKPVKYLLLSKVNGYLASGAGTWRFRLLNLRADTAFVLYRGGLDTPVFGAQSNAVTFANPNEPLGAHLAIGPSADASQTMYVSWASGGDITDPTLNPRVQYGLTPQNLQWTATANTTKYSKHDLCGAPATGEGWLPQGVGLLHTALLTNLQSQQQYYYRVGDDSSVNAGGWSGVYAFAGAPQPGDEFDLFAFGDLGQDQLDGTLNWSDGQDFQPSRNSTQQMSAIFKSPSNGVTRALVLHIGDIAYARGYASEWPNFFDQTEPLASALPWMTTDGNHERDYPQSGALFNGTDSGGECGVPYAHRFAMPAAMQRTARGDAEQDLTVVGHAVHDTPWYSQDFGLVHFVLMSTEHDFDTGSEQYAFLKADLAGVNRSVTPWIVFGGHRPMYIDSTNISPPDGDQPVATLLRQYVEPLLMTYGVDLALWGHHHSYQRSCPVFAEQCVPTGTKAPVHMVIGNAGAGLSQNIQIVQPPWVEVVNDQYYGFITIAVRNNALTMTAYESSTGRVMDTFSIPRTAVNA